MSINFMLFRNKNLLHSLVFSGLIAALYVFAPMRLPVDFPWHADAGARLLNGVGEISPHFLWHALIVLIHKISASSFMAASFIGCFLCVFVASIIVNKSFENETGMSGGIVAALTLVVFFVHPVFLLYPYDGHLYLGYFAPNPFHNPTFILLKPIALLHYILFCAVLKNDDRESQDLVKYLILSLLLALSAIAKPSYIVMFVPSVVLVVLLNLVFRPCFTISSKRIILITCTVLPGLVVLIWQFFHFFVEGSRGASIGIGFLGTYTYYSNPWTFPLKILGSILFPLSLILVMGRKLTRNIDFQISAAMLVISILYALFIVEYYNGKISGDGNWIWSSQLANFVLFFVCIRYYILEISSTRHPTTHSLRLLLPGFFLFLHLISGVVFYIGNVLPNVVHAFG